MDKTVILIIDDDSSLRKTLADILTFKGYATLVAKNGAEGLTLLQKSAVDLALIDLGLPDMPGLEVLDKIKAAYPFIGVIILTGNATLDSAIEATNRGAFSYLVKPYEIERLLLHVRRAIEKQQAEEKITKDSMELQKKNTELKVLYSVSLAISRMADLNDLLSEILRILAKAEIFTFEIKGAIFLVEGDNMRLASFISLSKTELEPCSEIKTGQCLCGQVLITEEITIARNCSENSRPAVHPHGHIIVPLKVAEVVVGLLNLYIQPDTEVNDETVRLLSAIASQMGIAINNARLFEETKRSSLHDALTGLANRRFMEIEFTKRLETAKRYREALSIIMLDIDHFKNYNDSHGHQEGDGLLIKLADILLRQVRMTDYVFRYGGEEFLVILPKMNLDMAHEAAERLRRAVEAEGGGLTISLGVVSLNESFQEKDTLIGAADKALYRAKANGRNRVAVG